MISQIGQDNHKNKLNNIYAYSVVLGTPISFLINYITNIYYDTIAWKISFMSTFPLSVFLLTSCFLHYYVRRGSSNSLEVPMWNSVSLLFVVENRKKSLISIAQALFLPLTDFGLFMAWSPVILLAFNVSTQTTYGVTLGFSILQSLAICLSTCIITYFGRRRVLIWSGAVMMLFQVINLIHFLVIKFAAHNIELIRIKFKY